MHPLARPARGGEKLTVGDFSLGKTLGTGAFGRVRFVTHKGNGRHYALKTLKKARPAPGDAGPGGCGAAGCRGARANCCGTRILAKLQHPFIVNMFGSFHDPRYIYMVLEYIVGGEFFTHLRKACGRMVEHGAAIGHVVYQLQIVHGQHYPATHANKENILINADGYVKLTDFGFAKVRETACPMESHWGRCPRSTKEYIAPEVLLNKGHGTLAATHRVDWWTLGILIYEMIVGYPPFVDEDRRRQGIALMGGMEPGELPGDPLTQLESEFQAKSLVKKLLTPDLGKRFGNLKPLSCTLSTRSWQLLPPAVS
eukprot:Skav231757  [mRNA]  locus=scaffold695:68056:73375:- [translate_table: standard]